MYDLFTLIYWSVMTFIAGSLLGMQFSDEHWKAIMILRERQREEAGAGG